MNLRRKETKEALIQFLATQPFTHRGVFAINQNASLEWSKRKLWAWEGRINRLLHGAANRPIFAFYAPEHISSNLHWNLACQVENKHSAEFERHAEAHWKEVVPSGDLD